MLTVCTLQEGPEWAHYEDWILLQVGLSAHAVGQLGGLVCNSVSRRFDSVLSTAISAESVTKPNGNIMKLTTLSVRDNV